jgi:radical SAM protein with 4Fe4S-binding SPASM domain
LDFDCKKNSEDLSDKKVVLMAEKLVENQIFSAIITGGEPLVRKHLTTELVRRFKEHNIDVSLNTNLQLLDEATLGEFIASHLDGVLISCPSTDSETYKCMTGGGDLQRFLSKLEILVQSGQHFSVNMVVNKRNLGNIRQSAESLRDMGVKIFGATPMGLNLENPDLNNLLTAEEVQKLIEDLMWAKDNLGLSVDIFEALPKCAFPAWIRNMDLPFLNRRCQAGKTVVSVSNNGDVRPCSHNPKSYGNILDEPLGVIWQRMAEWRNFETIPARCHDCKKLTKCFGGCRITAKAYTGDCGGEDPWMSSPILIDEKLPNKNPEIEINPDMSVSFAETFRWRHESGDDYLMTSTRNNRNITVVNKQLLSFVQYLKQACPLKLGNLAKSVKKDFTDSEFQRIIRLLLTRGFISPQHR